MEAYKKSLMWWLYEETPSIDTTFNSIFFTKKISNSPFSLHYYILLLFQTFWFTMKYQFDIYIIKAPKTFS